jgi:hypothetical protein
VNTNKRTAISATELYVLLNREFKRRQSRDCTECDVQLPYLVERGDANFPNWEVISPTDCGSGCRELVEEIALELSRRYDLVGEDKRALH